MTPRRNPFVEFVLDGPSPSHTRMLAAFDHIRMYPERIHELVSVDDAKDRFLVEFADRSNRLVQLFHPRIIKLSRFESKLATAILVGLLIPLLQASDELDRDALVKLLTSALGAV